MSGMTPHVYPVLSIMLEPAWVGPTMAIALGLIALSFIVITADDGGDGRDDDEGERNEHE